MGLLDNMPGMDTPEGQGLLAAAFSLMSAQKMPGQKGAFAGAIGDAGRQYMGTSNDARNQMQRRAMGDQQMKMQQLQLAEAERQRAERDRSEAAIRSQFSPGGTYDPRTLLGQGGVGALEQGMKIHGALNPAPKLINVAPGASVLRQGADGSLTPTFTAPDKADKPTSDIQNYQFAKSQGYGGSFEQWDTARKKAGATNIGMPKIDIKMGDSVAGQIGPMAKDSRVAAQGAVKMFDAATRMETALASGKVDAGPGTSATMTVRQFAQRVSGGNDEGIRQTGQVIRSLAQMAVEARKQLQGQGQVTDSEAKAVAKADAGDIDSLTVGELGDLVKLTKRAAHFTASSHQEIIDEMGKNQGTAGAASFYRVPGLEAPLKYTPQLPQIGKSAPNVDSLVNKYRSK